MVIFEDLKNDNDLYLRISVLNHLGDITKDHLDSTLLLCEKWLENTNTELKWVITHSIWMIIYCV